MCTGIPTLSKRKREKKHYLVNNCQPSITCQKVISQFMVHILLDTNLPGGPTVHSITESNQSQTPDPGFISGACPPLTS